MVSPKRNRSFRVVRARPRLFIATGFGVLIAALLPERIADDWITRWLIAWNSATVLYVALAGVMMAHSSDRHMRQRAQLQDDGKVLILCLAVLATIASLAAIAGELAFVKEMHGFAKGARMALVGCTVMASWAFIQMMFALHYAHEYYANVCSGGSGGLRFPGAETPGYGDFFYFSTVIGTSGQTADVAFESKPMRRIGTLHCTLAFFYNTTVLALLINIGAGLI
jgi:uncharacterized membrane protein